MVFRVKPLTDDPATFLLLDLPPDNYGARICWNEPAKEWRVATTNCPVDGAAPCHTLFNGIIKPPKDRKTWQSEKQP